MLGIKRSELLHVCLEQVLQLCPGNPHVEHKRRRFPFWFRSLMLSISTKDLILFVELLGLRTNVGGTTASGTVLKLITASGRGVALVLAS